MTSLPPLGLAAVMLAALVGVPLAAVAHELTHVLFLLPVAEDIRVDWRQMVVGASIPTTTLVQRWARVAGMGPVIVGVLVAVGLVAAGQPLADPRTPTGLCQWGIWMSYSITGGASDYLPSVSRQKAQVPGNAAKND